MTGFGIDFLINLNLSDILRGGTSAPQGIYRHATGASRGSVGSLKKWGAHIWSCPVPCSRGSRVLWYVHVNSFGGRDGGTYSAKADTGSIFTPYFASRRSFRRSAYPGGLMSVDER